MRRFRIRSLWTWSTVMVLALAACEMNQPVAGPREPPTVSVLDIAGSVIGDKIVGEDAITCGTTTSVTVALEGKAGLAANPVDVMLVLDRSRSMGQVVPEHGENLKAAATRIADMIQLANQSAPPGLNTLSRVGVVSFADDTTLDQFLTTNMNIVREAIDALEPYCTSHIWDGIKKGHEALLESLPGRRKVMVLITDGVENPLHWLYPDDPLGVQRATAAKAAGIEIFVIGYGNPIDETYLAAVASEPTAAHLLLSPDPLGSVLAGTFAGLGAAALQPAGTGITVIDTVHDSFTVSNAIASKGAAVVSGNVLTWTIDELGDETATLVYSLTHDDTKPGGRLHVNASVVYADAEGQSVTFPDPAVDVRGCAAGLGLTPKASENVVGDDHDLTATVTDDYGDPVVGIQVHFDVVGGASIVDGDASNPVPPLGSAFTDADGKAGFTFSNSEASLDTITATVRFGQPRVSRTLSDTAAKTWLPVEVPIDVHPRSCPNPFNVTRRGRLPVAIVGTANFDVKTVDITTIRLEGIAPIRSTLDDVVAAYVPYIGKLDRLDCTTAGSDGHLDLVLHFDAAAVAAAIAPVADGVVMPLRLTGEFMASGRALDFVGEDVVVIINKW